VKGIFVNIFGGIMKCDTIAEASSRPSSRSASRCARRRLEGTNVELGKKMLAESGLPITTAGDMADGARRLCVTKTISAGGK